MLFVLYSWTLTTNFNKFSTGRTMRLILHLTHQLCYNLHAEWQINMDIMLCSRGRWDTWVFTLQVLHHIIKQYRTHKVYGVSSVPLFKSKNSFRFWPRIRPQRKWWLAERILWINSILVYCEGTPRAIATCQKELVSVKF